MLLPYDIQKSVGISLQTAHSAPLALPPVAYSAPPVVHLVPLALPPVAHFACATAFLWDPE